MRVHQTIVNGHPAGKPLACPPPLAAESGVTMGYMTAPDCPECGGPFMDAPHPNYDHVHRTGLGQLPRAARTDSHQVTRGYAVGISGRVPQVWVFFDHLEPAVVFGRAGRMSGTDIVSYGVYEAAHELLYDDDLARDISILYVDLDADLRDHQTERPILERWLRGTHPSSARFQPPDDPVS